MKRYPRNSDSRIFGGTIVYLDNPLVEIWRDKLDFPDGPDLEFVVSLGKNI
jgi:hypothetical protein